jgi:hypothetical protein
VAAVVDEPGIAHLVDRSGGADRLEHRRHRRAPTAAVDDEVGGDAFARRQRDAGDVRDPCRSTTSGHQGAHHDAAAHDDTVGTVGERSQRRLDHRPPPRDLVEALVARPGPAGERGGQVGHAVRAVGAVRQQRGVHAGQLVVEDLTDAREEHMGQPELRDAAALPRVERRARHARCRRVAFEDRDVVAVLCQQQRRRQAAEAATHHHDPCHLRAPSPPADDHRPVVATQPRRPPAVMENG